MNTPGGRWFFVVGSYQFQKMLGEVQFHHVATKTSKKLSSAVINKTVTDIYNLKISIHVSNRRISSA